MLPLSPKMPGQGPEVLSDGEAPMQEDAFLQPHSTVPQKNPRLARDARLPQDGHLPLLWRMG